MYTHTQYTHTHILYIFIHANIYTPIGSYLVFLWKILANTSDNPSFFFFFYFFPSYLSVENFKMFFIVMITPHHMNEMKEDLSSFILHNGSCVFFSSDSWNWGLSNLLTKNKFPILFILFFLFNFIDVWSYLS